MKKLTIIAICAFAVSMVSCKKEQTCTCTTTITDLDDNTSISSSGSTTLKESKKKNEDACTASNKETTDATLNIKTAIKCEIK